MKNLAVMFIIAAVALPAMAIMGNNGEQKSDAVPVNRNQFELNESCLVELEKQMNLEKHASLVYKQMSAHFSNNNVAKKGFAGLFSAQAHEEHEHFEKFMNYIILRGNPVPAFNIEMPTKSKWDSVELALENALELENKVYNEIIRVHKIADKTCKDVHLMNFLESEFVEEQVASIAKITKLLTMVRNAGPGYGDYLIDRDIAQGKLKLDEL